MWSAWGCSTSMLSTLLLSVDSSVDAFAVYQHAGINWLINTIVDISRTQRQLAVSDD